MSEEVGTVVKVLVDKGFGFLRPDGQTTDLFFHRQQLDREIEWDDSLLERRVKFDRAKCERGERAVRVRPTFN
jgi:cold shock CspA family protein